MALYRIERPLDDASDDAIDAGVFRARACLHRFPGLRWVRSYLDRPGLRITCYYEAESADQIHRHAALAQIACDSVTEVTEILPDSYE